MTQKKRLFFLLVSGFTAFGFLSGQTPGTENRNFVFRYNRRYNTKSFKIIQL